MRILGLALVTLLLVAAGWAPGQPGAAATAALCSGEHRLRLAPGVTSARGRSIVSTEGGRIVCQGRIDGHDVSGRTGVFHQGGVLIGDCTGGVMAGTMRITIPTEDQPIRLTMAYDGTYGPAAGSISADRSTVSFQFHPTEGDCVRRPLTEIAVTQQMVIES